MLRFVIIATALTWPCGGHAQNPVLAADLVGRYWAYKEKCASIWGAFSKEEVAALGRVAAALGYEHEDSAANALAHERKLRHVMRWIDVGEATGCTETRIFLRGVIKQAMY